ncbi:Prevent-host-death family protein [uncultured spirochete]|jgi:prevent-host-death family protein|uniref:Prevent-host-death family protein n=1 Tax=uncultured spirochete TaxID=156406 RepID=A0A3P3XP54_9SPIR|nr:Prevent-host-death family protein [uncultured spirochete]
MAGHITANDLKTKGIGAIEQMTNDEREVIITVRGKQKYVILPIEEYNQLREFELDAAIQEAKRDIAEGRYHTGSIEEHMNRVHHV